MKTKYIIAALFCAASASHAQTATEQGIQAFKARKFAEARAVFQPLMARDAVAAYYMGRMAADENQLDRAADFFEKAVRLDPLNAEYYDWLGRAYGNQAQKASKFKLPFLARKTRNAWEKGLAIDPNNLDIMEDLVQYYLQAPGFLGGSKDRARDMINEIRKRNAYRGAVVSANICGSQKDSACVEREVRSIVAAYPDSTTGHVSLAALYANAKQFDQAFAVIDQRLKAKPNEMQMQFSLGRTAALSGQQLDRGERALKSYLADPPANGAIAAAHFRLGMIFAKKGEKPAARTEYLAALKINPNLADAKKSLADLDR